MQLLEEIEPIPDKLRKEIIAETDKEILTQWLKTTAKAESIEEFMRKRT